MLKSKTWVITAVIALMAVQLIQIVAVVHGESLTFDEDNHMYAGYRMWKNGDYGLNPEHPPLVKLLATLPVLGENLWVPPLKGIFFKGEAYSGGEEWLARNDGGSQRLVFRMRMAAALLAIALSLVVFFSTREWFGTTAALVALTLVVFDPNILAHSGLVTTDVGATLFFLATLYAFYRYVKQPTLLRLAIAGIVFGLLLATKHSGVLLGPMLAVLVCWEIAVAAKGTRLRTAMRLGGSLAAMVLLAVGVLWAFYGFRYAARPAGLQLIPSLAEYSQDLKPFDRGLIWWMAHLHLLPESYLMGMVDIRVFAKFFTTFILGNWYPHGVWWYFPVTISIKTTLGLIGLVLLAGFAIVTHKLGKGPNHSRALVYVLFVWIAYLATAGINGLNIGVRHVLPLYALAAVLAGALARHSAPGSALTMRGVLAARPSLYALRDELARIPAPLLLLAGDEDDSCLDVALMLKRTIPSAGLAVLPRTGHRAHREAGGTAPVQRGGGPFPRRRRAGSLAAAGSAVAVRLDHGSTGGPGHRGLRRTVSAMRSSPRQPCRPGGTG